MLNRRVVGVINNVKRGREEDAGRGAGSGEEGDVSKASWQGEGGGVEGRNGRDVVAGRDGRRRCEWGVGGGVVGRAV